VGVDGKAVKFATLTAPSVNTSSKNKEYYLEMTKQLAFGILKEIDQELEKQRLVEQEYWKRRNAEGHIEDWLESDPPSSLEWDIMTMGIRLCRFVNSYLECSNCGLDTTDHTLGFMFWDWDPELEQDIPVKVCVKDFLAKCKEWGIKYSVK